MKRSELIQKTIQFKSDMLTTARRSADAPQGNIDREKGIISNMLIVQVGEAKGHEVFCDQQFIQDVATYGQSQTKGIKCRFGHPAMCGNDALGTMLGRFHNFKVVGDACYADLHLSDVAKKSPQYAGQNLYDYILEMAEKESDMFGNSIVFAIAGYFQKDNKGNSTQVNWESVDAGEPLYVKFGSLHACDCVDTPAATEGAFAPSFSQVLNFDSWAVQAEEDLNTNPHLKEFLMSNSTGILAFLAKQNIFSKGKKPLEIEEDTNQKAFSFAAKATDSTGVEVAVTAQENAPKVGSKLFTADAEGNNTPAPDGTYAMPIDGEAKQVTVADGNITAIDAVVADPAPAAAAQLSADEARLETMFSGILTKQFSAFQKGIDDKFSALDKRMEIIEMNPQDRAAFARGQRQDKPAGGNAPMKSYEAFNADIAAQVKSM
jgi:hypothetical protein